MAEVVLSDMEPDLFPPLGSTDQACVSQKARKFYNAEKQFVKLRPAYSIKLVFPYVVKAIKIKITSKFRDMEPVIPLCRLQTTQTVQTVQTEYLFFLFFGEILISRNTNIHKQDRLLLRLP